MKIFKLLKSLFGFKQNSNCEAEIKKIQTVSKFKQKGEFSQKQTIYDWFVKNDNPYTVKQLFTMGIIKTDNIDSYYRAVNHLIKDGKVCRVVRIVPVTKKLEQVIMLKK